MNWLARSVPMGDRGITPVAGWVGKHRRIVVCPYCSFICVYDMINDMLCHAVRSPYKDMCMICQIIHIFVSRFKWLKKATMRPRFRLVAWQLEKMCNVDFSGLITANEV